MKHRMFEAFLCSLTSDPPSPRQWSFQEINLWSFEETLLSFKFSNLDPSKEIICVFPQNVTGSQVVWKNIKDQEKLLSGSWGSLQRRGSVFSSAGPGFVHVIRSSIVLWSCDTWDDVMCHQKAKTSIWWIKLCVSPGRSWMERTPRQKKNRHTPTIWQ